MCSGLTLSFNNKSKPSSSQTRLNAFITVPSNSSLGEYILLYDDDSIIEPNWIELHLKCIDYYNVEVSSGVSLATIGSKIPTSYSFYRWADQIDTGNVLIKKDVFRKEKKDKSDKLPK